MFACTRHRVLLAGACPACGHVPRIYTGPAGLNPPGTCPSCITQNQCCAADLRQVSTRQLTHPYRSSIVVNAALRTLAEDGHAAVLTAITALAGDLDEHGSPIDYQRRRHLIPAQTITASA